MIWQWLCLLRKWPCLWQEHVWSWDRVLPPCGPTARAAVGEPTCVSCSCCGRAELTRILLYTGPKVPGISHCLGICDMVNIQDLHYEHQHESALRRNIIGSGILPVSPSAPPCIWIVRNGPSLKIHFTAWSAAWVSCRELKVKTPHLVCAN